MAGIDATIPLGVKVPDGMSSIANIANTANTIQTLRTGQLQQQRTGIQLQQEQGALDARKNIATVMSDPSLRDPDTGLTDLNKLWPALQQADPKGYMRDEVFGKIAGVNTDMMKVKSMGMQLGDQEQTFIGQRLQTLAQEPNLTKDKVNATLDDAVKLSPASKPAADIIRKNVNALDVPETIGPVLMKFANMAFPLAAKAPATSFVANGQTITPVQSNALAGPVAANGPAIANAVPPTEAEQIVTDANGNRFRQVKDAQGRITIYPIPIGGNAPPSAAGGNGPQPPNGGARPMMSLPPGESPQTAANLAQERQTALQTLAGAPVMHATNRGVLEEIDKATTGTLGPRLAQVMSAAGVSLPKGWGGASAEEKASAYDLVGKYLERNAIVAAQSMGPHTNAGLDSQIKAQGSVAYNPTAIKKITQLNDALVTGGEHYQPGLEKAITTSPNQIFAKREYDQAWAQNFDPRVMMLYNAQSTGNKSEVQSLVRSWGGRDSPLTKDMLRRAANLDALSTTGHLP